MIASTIRNVNRQKRSDKVFKPLDFMPKEARPTDPNDLEAKIRGAFQHVATVLKHKEGRA